MTDTTNTTETTATDIAVVGAGLAGLIAATDAARAGHRVTLFDARHPGGRAASTDIRGFRFNQGAHALYDTGPARAILTSLGVSLTGGPPAVDRGRLVKQGRIHRLPAGPSSLSAHHRAVHPGQGRRRPGPEPARLVRRRHPPRADRERVDREPRACPTMPPTWCACWCGSAPTPMPPIC